MEQNTKNELPLKILASVIPFIVISLFIYITNNKGSSNENEFFFWLPYAVAITLGALPLIFGKVYFPHGKLTSIAMYTAVMFILLLGFSMFIGCWFLGQCL